MGLLKYLVSPSGFIAICFMIGLLAWFHRATRRWSYFLMPAGAIIYLLLSAGPVAHALLKPLEFKYGLYVADEQQPPAHFIVVMAGYAADEDYYPLSSMVNASSLFRLVEALHIWRSNPTLQIIITGHSEVPEIMGRVLVAMGVEDERIVLENRSSNSYESAVNVKAILQDAPFLLVTSAGHMPRSMGVFQGLGLSPIPAPTDYQGNIDPFKVDLLPTAGRLNFSDLALHEYLGLLWYRIRGFI